MNVLRRTLLILVELQVNGMNEHLFSVQRRYQMPDAVIQACCDLKF